MKMDFKNMDPAKKKLLFGQLLIAFGFICLIVVFISIGGGDKTVKRQAESAPEQMAAASDQPPPPKPVTLRDLVDAAKEVYGENEAYRKEGVLWIDRQSSLLIVTLGALNGVKAGQQLNVYDDNDNVGAVTVDIPLDIISYVTPKHKSIGEFENDYYRVVIASSPIR